MSFIIFYRGDCGILVFLIIGIRVFSKLFGIDMCFLDLMLNLC